MEDSDRSSRSARSAYSRGLIDAEQEAERRLGFAKARAKEDIKNRELRGESRGDESIEDGVTSDVLLRARRVVLGKRRNSTEEMAKRLAEERMKESEAKGEEESELERVSEFCKRFKTVVAEQQQRQNESQHVSTERDTRETGETGETEKTGETKEEKVEEKSESESEPEEFFEQPTLGKGLGDALKYLRAQKVQDVEEEAYGRRNDTMIKSSNEEGRNGA